MIVSLWYDLIVSAFDKKTGHSFPKISDNVEWRI